MPMTFTLSLTKTIHEFCQVFGVGLFLMLSACAATQDGTVSHKNTPTQSKPEAGSDELTDEQKRLPMDGFMMGYDFSYNLDFCGERELGRKYRKVIFDKVDSCPFNEDVKKDFYKNAARVTEEMLRATTYYVEKNSKLPNEGMGDFICKNRKDMEQMARDIEQKIDQYSEGKMKINDFLGSCREGASLRADIALIDYPPDGAKGVDINAHKAVNRTQDINVQKSADKVDMKLYLMKE